MPAPAIIAPIAIKAAQIGLIALAAYAISRRRDRPIPPERETALDELEEGMEMDLHREREALRADAGARWSGTVRLGPGGPGLDIDATALGRLRLRPVRAGER